MSYVQTQKTTLSGSGVTATDTTIILSSFKLPDGATTITMSDFGTTGFGTLEAGTSREESISFTGITQNANGTATLTGVTRGLRLVSPYDEVSANKFAHAGGSTFTITNTSAFYSGSFANPQTAQTVSGQWTYTTLPESAVTPTGADDLTNKAYVDSVVNGGAVSYERLVVTGNAGETVAAGDVIYFDEADQEWKKADADVAYENKYVGIAQGAGTDGASISGGILLFGTDENQTSLTPGADYYISTTTGELTSTEPANGYFVGKAKNATTLIVSAKDVTSPNSFIDTSAGAADSGKGVKLNADGKLDSSFGVSFEFGDGSDGDVTISSPTTLTRDMYYDNLTVNDTLTTDGYRIFVKGTLDGTGTIDWGTPNNASITTGGDSSGSGPLVTTAGGNGNSTGNQPSAGAACNVGTAGSAGSDGDWAGSSGAAGSTLTKGYGNLLQLSSIAAMGMNITPGYTFESLKNGAGGGGGTGTSNGVTSGGGGASGGTIVIFAKTWAGTFGIQSIGGDGANGTASGGDWGGGGAGGNGGIVITVYGTKTWTGSYTLTGGAAGIGGNGTPATASSSGTSYEIQIGSLI